MFASDYFQSEKAFRAMLPGKIALTALRIAESECITPREALARFYASAAYRSLEDESTKCWWESPHELHRDYDTLKHDPFPSEVRPLTDYLNSAGCRDVASRQ